MRRRLLWALAAVLSCALVGAVPSRAADTPRFGHAAALMPDGRILLTGGDNGGGPIGTVERLDMTNGGAAADATAMAFARSSHTITVLPNGNILVTGGWDGAASRSDAEVYTPATDSWVTVAGMQSGRFNHTATLLNTGNILVCGGQTTAGAVTNTCDLFTPAGAGGSFATTGNLLLGRALHTATHLNDDTVWVAGGWQPTGTPYIVTTERYNPTSGVWQQSNPMGVARAYHTATLTGDSKVLVVGGFNSASPLALASTELFDPVGGSIQPGPPLQAGVQAHTALLRSQGDVAIFGGRGNIPNTPFANNIALGAGSNVTAAFAGDYGSHVLSGGAMTAGTPTDPVVLRLGVPVSGQVYDGEIQFYNPSVTLSGSSVTFAEGPSGLKVDLDGQTFTCDANEVCGYLSATLPFIDIAGDFAITLPVTASNLFPSPTVSGSLTFNPAITSSQDGTVTNGNFTATLRVAVPDFIPAGAMIDNVQLSLSASGTAGWTQASSYTVTLDGGTGSDTTCPCPVQVSGTLHYIQDNFTFVGLTGRIVSNGSGSYTLASPVAVPLGGSTPRLGSLSAAMSFESSRVDLTGATLRFSSATVVIRDMVFGDYEFFDPRTNQWSFQPPSGPVTRPGTPMYGHAAVLLPNNDNIRIGGKDCQMPGCAGFEARNVAGLRPDPVLLTTPDSFASGGAALGERAFHTATLLTDGTILLAGGTNGDAVLPTAEIFDPATQAFQATATLMRTARENHSATLLTNGRVLIAGGFATTADSTGPTKAAEIYYPDTRTFVPTSPMISSHSNHTAITLPDGRIFVAGGYSGQTTVSDVAEIYSSTSGVWTPAATMGANKRALHASVLLKDGRVMLCGGTDETGILDTAIAYNPATNAWDALAPMGVLLQGHTATLLPDGRVLVAGGNNGSSGETTTSRIFDPTTGAWSSTGASKQLNSARYNHTATMLPNGNVLVSGGVQQTAPIPGSPANALKSVEFFHPDRNSWTTVDLAGERSFHTATLAPDGILYLMGGTNGSIGAGVTIYSNYESSYFTSAPDNRALNAGSRQSTVYFTEHSTTTPFLPADSFAVNGTRFRGATEANSGAAGSASSSFSYPRMVLQKIEGSGGSGSQSSAGFSVDLTTFVYATAANQTTLDTRLTVTLPGTPASHSSLPYGWYMAWISANDIHTVRAPFVQIGPARPTTAVTSIVGVPASTTTIAWSWTAPLAGAFDGYNVYSATTGVFISTVAGTSFTQTDLPASAAGGIIVAPYTLSGDGPLLASPTYYTFSTAPISVAITSVTYSDLLLQWNPNGNAAGTIYEVSMSTDFPAYASFDSVPVPFAMGLTNNFVTISQLRANTNYAFRVRAYNGSGLPSAYSASVSTLTRTAVSVVSGNATSPTSILWQWSPAPDVLSYRVFNATTTAIELIATTAGTSFSDVGLATNTPRAVQIAAVTTAGQGPLSSTVTVYTAAAPPLPNSPPITDVSSGSFVLGWRADDGNPASTQYKTLIATGAVVISTLYTTGYPHTLNVTDLNPSQSYTIYLHAINGDGLASSALVVGSTYTLPRVPGDPVLSGATSNSISFTWSANNNPANVIYQVTYTAVEDPTVVTPIPFSAGYTGLSAAVGGLVTSWTYNFAVQARNPAGGLSASLAYSAPWTTPNGGAAPGALAGILNASAGSEFGGSFALGAGPLPRREITVRSPAGAFPSDVNLTISSHDVTGVNSLCTNGVDIGFELEVDPLFQPLKPIRLTVAYDPAELGPYSTDRLALMRYDPASGTCVPLSTTFDTAGRTFSVALNHFSLYQIAAVPVATSADTARIFPNPYRAARDGYVTIDRIPPLSRVRVTTLRGETVFDQQSDSRGILVWSPTNGAGRSIASGLYLVVVESGGTKKILKLAVVR